MKGKGRKSRIGIMKGGRKKVKKLSPAEVRAKVADLHDALARRYGAGLADFITGRFSDS